MSAAFRYKQLRTVRRSVPSPQPSPAGSAGEGGLQRIWNGWFLLLPLLASVIALQSEAQVKIDKHDYRGWPNTYTVSNGLIEAKVVTDIGPRIIDVRLTKGDNLLQERE